MSDALLTSSIEKSNEIAGLREQSDNLTFALKEIRAAIKETAGAEEDELLLMLDGIARDALAGNELNSPQESGSKLVPR